MNLSEEIVSINNVVSEQSKVLIENLLEMDANVKKFTLLENDVYRDYFDEAQELFNSSLLNIEHLTARGYTVPAVFSLFLDEYNSHIDYASKTGPEEAGSIVWVDETQLNTWLALLVQFRDINQNSIEESLMNIHDMTMNSMRNGLIGFGFSIVASFFGIWFISRSIISPLKKLTYALRTMSTGEYGGKITVSSKDEFRDLAVAYNEMNSELVEQENLRADFIASLSHEIRTPLSSIQESVNMVAEEVLGDINQKQQKFLSIASSELERITGLLNHLMDVSILESQSAEKRAFQIIDPKLVMDDCITGISSAAEHKQINITYSYGNNIGNIEGRVEEIQQVFFNIIGNGIKFSPVNSEIHITILKDSNPDYVLFTISDQGPGIPESELTLIFNKYYRSRSVRKHMNGVGLGLFISRKIVQSLGGGIQVENNPDRGCTFSIFLPTT